VSLFVWAFTFDLSSLGDPASSYATAGLAVSVNFNVNFNALLDKYTVSGIPRTTRQIYSASIGEIKRLCTNNFNGSNIYDLWVTV